MTTRAALAAAAITAAALVAAPPAGGGLLEGVAHLDPDDLGAHQPTCTADGPEWEWTFGFREAHLLFTGPREVMFTTPAAEVHTPTNDPTETWRTPGPAELVGGWATYLPEQGHPMPEPGSVRLELLAVCAPAQAATSTTAAPTTTDALPATSSTTVATATPAAAAVRVAPAFTG